jgi:antitoxin (DNA-binding transcriptional repressor) of toxin-antitoxin stability system
MIIVNVSEAKAQLTRLLQRAEAGEQVFISRRNEPVVELRLVQAKVERPKPQFGLCAGEFKVPDDFDDPLPDDILAAFNGE